jgi:hypothetical protein
MKVILNYWNPSNRTVVTESGFRYVDTTSVITKEVEVEGTEEEIFKDFYDKNNRLRYCNGSYYRFKDISIEEKYQKWYDSLNESTRFHMYYGNGIVD